MALQKVKVTTTQMTAQQISTIANFVVSEGFWPDLPGDVDRIHLFRDPAGGVTIQVTGRETITDLSQLNSGDVVTRT